MCSVVSRPIRPGGWNGSVEPLSEWRRLVRSTGGQESHATAGGIRDRRSRFLPEGVWSRVERLPGVAGMACTESNQVNHGRSGYGPSSRQGNLPSGKECRIQKSERLIVVMTPGTTQPWESEGVVRSHYLFGGMTVDTVPKGVSRVL